MSVRNSKYVTAIDSQDGFTMLHYNTELLPAILEDPELTSQQREEILSLRGVIVDSNDQIVCPSFGYTESQTYTDFSNLKIRGTEPVDMSTTQIFPFYEGTVLRKWKRNNVVYSSTHRRISAHKSRWGGSKTFPEIYAELNGPSDDTLFDSALPDAAQCYVFMLSVPSLQCATKMDLGAGWLFLLHTFSLDGPLRFDTIPTNIPPPSTTGVLIPQPLKPIDSVDLTAAHRILTTGYSPLDEKELEGLDYRIHPGEPVLLKLSDGRMIKVAPVSYLWRLAMHANNPNRKHRFYQLYNLALKPHGDVSPPIFDGTDREYSFEQLIPRLQFPSDDVQTPLWRLDTAEEYGKRISAVFWAYVMALPLHSQSYAVTNRLDLQLIESRNKLNTYLSRECGKLDTMDLLKDPRFGKDNKLTSAGRALQRILTTSANYVKGRVASDDIYDENGQSLSELQIRRKSISGLVARERGMTLYALVNAILKQ